MKRPWAGEADEVCFYNCFESEGLSLMYGFYDSYVSDDKSSLFFYHF